MPYEKNRGFIQEEKTTDLLETHTLQAHEMWGTFRNYISRNEIYTSNVRYVTPPHKSPVGRKPRNIDLDSPLDIK